MATDLSLSSVNQFLALINTANSTVLNTSLITIGNPTAHVGGDPGSTDVVVTSIADAIYSNKGLIGSRTINYTRLDMANFGSRGSLEFILGDSATVADLITAFNLRFGTALDSTDYDNSLTIPAFDNVGTDVIINAHANSLIYRGSVTVVIKKSGVALSTIITTPVLNGMAFPS